MRVHVQLDEKSTVQVIGAGDVSVFEATSGECTVSVVIPKMMMRQVIDRMQQSQIGDTSLIRGHVVVKQQDLEGPTLSSVASKYIQKLGPVEPDRRGSYSRTGVTPKS